MTEQLADWQNHHISGYARAALEQGKDSYFNAPLISHIKDNLYVGGCIDGVTLDADFQTVISLYKWEKYNLGPDTERFEYKMYDDSYTLPVEQLNEIADVVSTALDKGGKVLVHCQAGLNRSNLITALALIKRGSSPKDAVALLREKRSPLVLCNPTFEQWLLSLSEENHDS